MTGYRYVSTVLFLGYISDLLIVEKVSGQFLIEGKLPLALPSPIGILGTNSVRFNSYLIYIYLASDKMVCLDLYQLHSLQSNQYLFISSMVEA